MGDRDLPSERLNQALIHENESPNTFNVSFTPPAPQPDCERQRARRRIGGSAVCSVSYPEALRGIYHVVFSRTSRFYRIISHVLVPLFHLLVSYIVIIIQHAQDHIAVYGVPRLTHRALHENTYMHGCLTRLNPTTHDVSTHSRKETITMICVCNSTWQQLCQMSFLGSLGESKIFLVPYLVFSAVLS